MQEGTGVRHKAKAHLAERTGDQRVAVQMCDARGGFRKQITDRVQGCAVGSKVDAFPMSPLKPFSLSPTCQGGAEEPVSGPGQAAPCVLGCDRPGGYLPAGPAEKPRREKGLC